MDMDAIAGLGFNTKMLGGNLVHIEQGDSDFLHHDVAVAGRAHGAIVDDAVQNGGVGNQRSVVSVAAVAISTALARMVMF